MSAPAWLLLRPFRGYEELARAEGDDLPTVFGGVARLVFVIGAVVATTATGRLAPVELVIAALSFGYVPLLQLVALGAALRALSPSIPLRHAFALYLAGHGPALVALVTIAATCLLAPSPAAVLFALVPPLVLGMFGWSGVLTYACLRRGLGLSAGRAAVATAVHALVLIASVVAYFFGSGQLGPLLWT